MRREDRIALHKKQQKIQVKKGAPRLAEMTDGVREIRFTESEGLVEYVKYKNVLHKKVFS